MKKLFILAILAMLLVSSFSVMTLADSDDGLQSQVGADDSNDTDDDSADDVDDNDSDENETDLDEDEEDEERQQAREQIRERLKDVAENLNVSVKDINMGRKVTLSSGRKAEIKVMPITASERALERLRLKVCSEENNCTIQLKEVGSGNETRLAYGVRAEKRYKVLGLFRAKRQVESEIDAETGEVIRTRGPWWAFLATDDTSEEETSENGAEE